MQSNIAQFTAALPPQLDGALICSDVGRAYLTGMHSSAGTLLVLKDRAYLIIDFRYIEKAKRTAQGCKVILQDKLYEQINTLLKRHDAHTLGVESGYMTVGQYLDYGERLSVKLVMDKQVTKLLEKLRMHKSAEELAQICEAQRFTDATFDYILGYIRPGMTEREIAREMRDYADRQGSQGPSFDYIVVSGKNSSLPHGVPSDKSVQDGDFITMDFGCLAGGYCSDMTRTVAVGHCTDEMHKVYDTVLQAQLAGIAAIRPGITCKAVDAVCRDLIYQAGFEGCFGHGTGHSLGLEIHEAPACNMRDESVCEEGLIMTVEPGIYLEDRFGVRIEDMVFITAQGCRNLTNAPKNLIIL